MTATTYQGPTIFAVIDRPYASRHHERVIAETDDWLEAEYLSQREAERHRGRRRAAFTIDGTHPTHQWVSGRCTACTGWDNGSYRSHAPCGFDFEGQALIWHIKRWATGRDTGPPSLRDVPVK